LFGCSDLSHHGAGLLCSSDFGYLQQGLHEKIISTVSENIAPGISAHLQPSNGHYTLSAKQLVHLLFIYISK